MYAKLSQNVALDKLAQGVCFEYTSYCMGFYVENIVATAAWNMHGLSWKAGVPSESVPAVGSANFGTTDAAKKMVAKDVNYGFHKDHFFTAAGDWVDLSVGALFYRFQTMSASPKYETGGTLGVTAFSNKNPTNVVVEEFLMKGATELLVTGAVTFVGAILL